MDISAKTKDHPEAVTVQYDVPDTLAALQTAFGDEVVANAAKGAIVISLQSYIRRHIDKPQAELQELVSQWRPDTRQPAVKQTAMEKVSSNVAKLTPEERQALLNQLKALSKG